MGRAKPQRKTGYLALYEYDELADLVVVVLTVRHQREQDYFGCDTGTHMVEVPILVPHLPIWLTTHREIRSSARIRAVYDCPAEAVPVALLAAGGGR